MKLHLDIVILAGENWQNLLLLHIQRNEKLLCTCLFFIQLNKRKINIFSIKLCKRCTLYIYSIILSYHKMRFVFMILTQLQTSNTLIFQWWVEYENKILILQLCLYLFAYQSQAFLPILLYCPTIQLYRKQIMSLPTFDACVQFFLFSRYFHRIIDTNTQWPFGSKKNIKKIKTLLHSIACTIT